MSLVFYYNGYELLFAHWCKFMTSILALIHVINDASCAVAGVNVKLPQTWSAGLTSGERLSSSQCQGLTSGEGRSPPRCQPQVPRLLKLFVRFPINL